MSPVEPVFFHVDLDAFYASVEQHDDPALRGRPVIVGAAPGHRGVVSACSYEARRFGVRSAMPISEAWRRCPQGVYLPVRMERYLEVSRAVMAILDGYTPHVQQISVDEAFLDMTGTERLFGPPLAAGRRLKEEVRAKSGLALTVGIGPNRYVAKLATNAAKPDGLLQVQAPQVLEFLDGLALRDLWGIGEKTLARLAELNITSVALLRAFPARELSRLLGAGASGFLAAVSRGEDPGIFSEEPTSRSISRKDRAGIERVLLELCHQVMFRSIDEKCKSRTPTLKLRFHDFTTVSAQKTLKHWVTSADELFSVIRGMLAARWSGATPVRLVGVGLASLVAAEAEDQMELFADEFTRQKRVEEAVFRVRRKMGDAAVTKASLMDGQRRTGRDPRRASGREPGPGP